MANSKIEKKVSGSQSDRINKLSYYSYNIDSSIPDSTERWNSVFYFGDKNKKELGGIYIYNYNYDSTNLINKTGIQLESIRIVNNERINNYLRLNINNNGEKSIEVSSPAAWRTAINAVNKAGDNMTGTIVSQPGPGVSYIQGVGGQSAGIYVKKRTLNIDEWIPGITIQTKSGGGWAIGNYNSEYLQFIYGTKANIDAGNNTTKVYEITPEGTFTGNASGIKTPSFGYNTNIYGNFTHNSTNTTHWFHIQDNATNPSFSVNYETGEIQFPKKPLSINYGGTGATTAQDACRNLGVWTQSKGPYGFNAYKSVTFTLATSLWWTGLVFGNINNGGNFSFWITNTGSSTAVNITNISESSRVTVTQNGNYLTFTAASTNTSIKYITIIGMPM